MNAELFTASPSKGEQARQRLLLAALEKIGEKGYENASVREIAEEAGQNIAAISYYFGSKESLYTEVIQGIGSYLNAIFGEMAREARDLLESGQMDREKAADILKRILRLLLTENIERSEIAKIRKVMIREQSSPTAAFDLLYQKALFPLHDLFTRTLAAVSGEDPQSEKAIIRAHMLVGQVIAFTVARSTILRRLDAEKYEKEHAAIIAATLDEHIDFVCAGLIGKDSK